MRAYNCLKRAGITKVGEVLDKLSRGQGNELLAIRNFGQKSFQELLTKLREKDLLPAEGGKNELQEDVSEGTASPAKAELEGEVLEGSGDVAGDD